MGAKAEQREAGAGRYYVEHELARGGMGIVYRALDRSTGKAVALKRPLQQGASSDLLRDILRGEYETLVTLRHPSIIEVYDFGIDADGPYYTMELLSGSDLRESVPLPWREVCRYVRDVASSLALLHSRRLLHRDVSVANIRLTSGGRAKLLDFGGLTSFGRSERVVGSPPTTAPEVLAGEELDARVDLYALGATAYCALTGRHAYPATVLSLLPAVWSQDRPRLPSAYAADVPAELEELVLSLLDLDRSLRPESAAEVMERLSAIAGLAPEHDRRVAHSYLLSTGLIGRDKERELLATRLGQALDGAGGGVIITGGSGLGKSVLLDDVLQKARVAGARVLAVHARAHPQALGSWSALVREAAWAAGEELRGEAREASLLALAGEGPLVLSIEDLHEADPDSLATFTTLIKTLRDKRTFVVCTLDPTQPGAATPAARLLLKLLQRVELLPFDARTTQAFVKALFGDVAATRRLAAFLLDHAAGNPRASTELARHLIEQGAIRYAEGTWTLPQELPTLAVGSSGAGALADAMFEARIAHFSPALRAMAQALSVHRRALEGDVVKALVASEPDLAGKSLIAILSELVREGVLIEDRGAYAFARPRIQQVLYGRLSEDQRRVLHLRLAELLAATVGNDPRRGFEIAFHYLLARDDQQARAFFDRNIVASFLDPDLLIEAVPDVRAVLDELRTRGASDEDVQFVEGTLVISGFYLDPSVYDGLAERCLPLLHRRMGFALANRLAPWLSRPLALLIGLGWAWLRSLLRRSAIVNGGPFLPSLLSFVGVCASLSAGACFRIDRRRHQQLRELLDVAKGLGRLNSLRLVYDLFEVGGAVVRGRLADAERGLEDQLERVPRIAFLTPEGRHQFQAGLEFFLGWVRLPKPGSGALEAADRIDALGAKHDRLLAQLLRRTHYLYRGEVAAVKREEERFDEMAARFGSRWVPDLVAVLEFTPYHLTGDVLGLKRILHRMDEFLPGSPGLKTHRQVISAMYEGHRGRPDRALEIYAELEGELAPFSSSVWSVARGHQAECLNTLGHHAEALNVCEAALAHVPPGLRAYAFAFQQLEREAAQALARLGRAGDAVRLVDRLLAECEVWGNPLLLAVLHLDRARLACVEGAQASFEEHMRSARASVAETANPALALRTKRVIDLGRAAGLRFAEGAAAGEIARATASTAMLGRRSAGLTEGLRRAAEAAGARVAYLYLVLNGKVALAAQHGAEDPPDLESQIAELVAQADFDWSRLPSWEAPPSLRASGPAEGTFVPLFSSIAGTNQLVGVLALASCEASGVLTRIDLSLLTSELIVDDIGATDVI